MHKSMAQSTTHGISKMSLTFPSAGLYLNETTKPRQASTLHMPQEKEEHEYPL